MKVGDKVKVIDVLIEDIMERNEDAYADLVGAEGIIVTIDDDNEPLTIGVALDRSNNWTHGLDGLTPDDNGRWFSEEELELLPKVKQWDNILNS